jgi:hypothetical protein
MEEQRVVRPASQSPMDAPRWYVIHAEGPLDQTWSDRLGGLTISVTRCEGDVMTELSGLLLDQSALMGVLMGLYDLGMPLISVMYQPIQAVEKVSETHTPSA